jgi:mannan endo-1,4-beta-mannosidase
MVEQTTTSTEASAATEEAAEEEERIILFEQPEGEVWVPGPHGEVLYDLGDEIVGEFVIEFTLTARTMVVDLPIILTGSQIVPTTFKSYYVLLRMVGEAFDARNGDGYDFVGKQWYDVDIPNQVRMEVDIPNRTYSAWVTNKDYGEKLVADEFLFRAGTPEVWDLRQFALVNTNKSPNDLAEVTDLVVYTTMSADEHAKAVEEAKAGLESYYMSLAPTGAVNRPAGAVGNGLAATYFNGTDLGAEVATRVDATVDFDWGKEAPVSEIDADSFSSRWEGRLLPTKGTGPYTIIVEHNDGGRFTLGDQLLVDEWEEGVHKTSVTVWLDENMAYPIVFEQFEGGGGALARLSWVTPDETQEVIPQAALLSQ